MNTLQLCSFSWEAGFSGCDQILIAKSFMVPQIDTASFCQTEDCSVSECLARSVLLAQRNTVQRYLEISTHHAPKGNASLLISTCFQLSQPAGFDRSAFIIWTAPVSPISVTPIYMEWRGICIHLQSTPYEIIISGRSRNSYNPDTLKFSHFLQEAVSSEFHPEAVSTCLHPDSLLYLQLQHPLKALPIWAFIVWTSVILVYMHFSFYRTSCFTPLFLGYPAVLVRCQSLSKSSGQPGCNLFSSSSLHLNMFCWVIYFFPLFGSLFYNWTLLPIYLLVMICHVRCLPFISSWPKTLDAPV